MNPAVFCVPYSTVFTPGCSTNVLDSTDAGTRRTGDVACGAVRACVCRERAQTTIFQYRQHKIYNRNTPVLDLACTLY
eukprot:COSAG02_NODE_5738_length_4078_cov_2.919326_4_plen_78_part_00